MATIGIVVATTSPDIKADGIVAAVRPCTDMDLLGNRVLSAWDVDEVLTLLSDADRCALVLVGRSVDTSQQALVFLLRRADLVVLRVDIVGDLVNIRVRDPRLNKLLDTVRVLTEGRIPRFELDADWPTRDKRDDEKPAANLPLLCAGFHWVHAVLHDAVERVPEDAGDAHGLSLTRASLLQSLDPPPGGLDEKHGAVMDLNVALAASDGSAEPLARVVHTFSLEPLEFRLLLLSLAPDLDVRFQRCIGFLLDDMSRRVGPLSFYCGLLGAAPRVRADLAEEGKLWRWLAYESPAAGADEPLRLDPLLTQWIFGERGALAGDARIRGALREAAWPGESVLERQEERAAAARLHKVLRDACRRRWILLSSDDPAAWRAILELGADEERPMIRVEPARLAGAAPVNIEDAATRIARMARLTGDPLVIDVADADRVSGGGECAERFLACLDRFRCGAAIICRDHAAVIRQMVATEFDLVQSPPLDAAGRVAAVREAARGADADLTDDSAQSILNRFPLSVDGMEQAMRLAASRPLTGICGDPRLARFIAACRELAVEGISQLAERIEPAFRLEDVVLPPDRKRQLTEIVDHVRLAPQVLDGWKFRAQLPYGRGVSALFFGPSGTGKTMAAMGVAHALGVQLLRIDLSRVVSKYIGDTEKNIDRVFTDAQKSGAAILIDEADALLGKRSEVKDAHDRYANIEVAYLLQRMEAYEGLAILTSNMRQNLDAAFLRRLRFIVEFPRPDANAREQIWRFCLPEESHDLDDAGFRHLARKIDLTGGHIRQITLRAAFLAAAAGTKIALEHIAEAARAEFAKLGMPPVEIDANIGRRAA